MLLSSVSVVVKHALGINLEGLEGASPSGKILNVNAVILGSG
jgi:hypothetical protein